MRLRHLAATLLVGLASSTAFALPPNSPYHEGANHHIGDKSFVAEHGHAPTKRDSEPSRMHAHFAYVRSWLASRPATKPELAEKRAKILAAFDTYIAKGTTPANTHMPWRTPVFIDDAGTICAVGFLIEQTAGRPLAEKIASKHRYDVLEDIASDMPEVRDWVAASGLTLEELATIQPAYTEPRANTWRTWNLAKYPKADGAYDKDGVHGAFLHGDMTGAWTVTAKDKSLLGSGTMKHGAGAWTAFYPGGKKRAEGRYADNRAEGPWKLYHPSGNLAAEGAFSDGTRAGRWHFYYDTPSKTPIAVGSFSAGWVAGLWKHYDAEGKLIATSRDATPDLWDDQDPATDGGDGSLLDLVTPKGGVHHVIHQGTVGSALQRLDMFARGGEHLYVQSSFEKDYMFDGNGQRLEHGDAGWTTADCGWNATRKQIARDGDIVRLHGLLYKDSRRRTHASRHAFSGVETVEDTGPKCHAPKAIAAARATELDALLAERDRVRAIPPPFVKALVLREEGTAPTPDEDLSDDDKARVADMTQILAANMSMYLEWPHIDGAFIQLFDVLPGRVTFNWYDGDPEARENQPDPTP